MNPLGTQPINPKKVKVGNTLTVTQIGEKTIFTVRRHPIGLLGAYVLCGGLIVAVAVMAFVLVPNMSSGSSSNSKFTVIATLLFLIISALAVGFALIVTKIYWGNMWVLTTDSLTQVTQNSPFDRQSSQLSLHNLEDISAEQNGLFPHMFNYGLLKVETAGEASRFTFNYCPNPNFYAQQILSAREIFLQANHDALMTKHSKRSIPSNANFLDPDEVEVELVQN